ncbi:MAG: DUF2829 domain-containing protein [Muribaculaceae bacterium]
MKKYIGTKVVTATPAIRKGGKVYLPTDEIPKSMEPVEEGYKVIYEDGYESWSPKDVFEKAYRIAETPLDCVMVEYYDLDDKCCNMSNFIKSDEFKKLDSTTQAMLVAQMEAMTDYIQALALRFTRMESGDGGYNSFGFGVAITLLKKGFSVRREGWNGKGLMVFKQVPAHIDGTIIPKMQSLPQSAIEQVMKHTGFIDYTSQCLIYNSQTGRADSWVPSISDVFANDWELVTE